MFSDTLGVGKAFKKTELQSHAFYDTMRNSKSWFVRSIANFLIGTRSSADDAYAIKENVVSKDYFTTFAGKVITKINIVNVNIFSRTEDDDLSWTEQALESLHVKTRYDVIAKNLLFKVGQTVNPYTFATNEQLLRSKSYLATAFIIIINDKKHPDGVIVNVFTRDNWTISVSGVLGSNPRGDIFDRNFVGSGNMLKFSYYPKTSNQMDAFMTEYAVNNLGGTFANATLFAGIGGTTNAFHVKVDRPFILPSDHIWGGKIGYVEERIGLTSIDTMIQYKREEIGLHYGFSVNLNRTTGTSLYFTTNAHFKKFTKKLEPTKTMHPFFTDRLSVLANVGISQQNFFQGNMIYGYGRTEDIPYGYKFEVVGGWEKNFTLGDRLYFGAEARWGGLTKAGYFDFTVGGGSYLTPEKRFQQVDLRASINYFSPLFSAGSLYLRQFANINYRHGIRRLDGEMEKLTYYSGMDVRGLRVPDYMRGVNRFVINTETVFFTPIFFYHFRFAFFSWIDAGWLGMNDVFYKNEFSSALGVGVRIKNERLIFNNIQIRFGVSLKRPSDSRFSWFDINNEKYLDIKPFIPQPAEIPEFN